MRCFEDDNIHHVEGSIDPVRDIETIQIELALADLASVERRLDKTSRTAKSGDKEAKTELAVLEKILPVLEEGHAARTAELTDDEKKIAKSFFLLTTKPTIYASNVDEASIENPDENPHVATVKEYAKKENAEVVMICAKIEEDLIALEPEERTEFLLELGAKSSGVDQMIASAYKLLGLMSFLTAG